MLEARSALWAVGAIRAGSLAEAACDALVAGLDSEALRALAGATDAESDFVVVELLDAIAADMDIQVWTEDSAPARVAAAQAMARLCVDGELQPLDFVNWLHQHVMHGHPDPRIEVLVSLSDDYGILRIEDPFDSAPWTQELNETVINAARRLIEP